MLTWSAIFFVIALVAGVFGLGGISEAATDVALILFVIALIGFLITLAIGLFIGKKAKDVL